MTASPSHRLIRLIHVARRDLRMAEDTYRAIIAQYAGGKTSSGDCAVDELEAILAHLKRAGFKIRKPAGARPKEDRALDMAAESTKVRALWLLLHRLGAVRDPSEKALASYARRQAGVDDLHWAGAKMFSLIEGLKRWAQRVFPEQLQARLAAMQQAGYVDQSLSVYLLIVSSAPKRAPGTFDAMLSAWEYLDAKEEEASYGR